MSQLLKLTFIRVRAASRLYLALLLLLLFNFHKLLRPHPCTRLRVHTLSSHAELSRGVTCRAVLNFTEPSLCLCVWNQCAALEAGTRSPLLQGCGEQTTERWPISVWPHGSLHLPPFNLLLAPERKESSTQATHLLPDPGMPAPRMHSALHYSLI